ncbi:D-alanyl-D-alanine carboxypeptidase-like protein [Candidatus Ornithobacterium hominis]|uniref:M15 family metallopeptidase n=1 Tax=Candidatus Ornithobacterium hominis TaxID=2497989 RepID=UPI0024BCEEDF|nr:M15 family metallopeptidase [Candidatus Ornithobacterium hominis]CAI9429275.1 D-alanyl-D-alanine carboxypeptidase-like protein [Candidatus Ornithobacterium hominis]CAI9429687.1 D-alanyl-D-alanine carboxypeptidase-like protein [Candidatus Ornithobacterium hominis]
MIQDKPTREKVEKLHPKIRPELEQIIQECDRALTGRAKLRITQGYRTIAEQNALYAQGRTKPGKRVTNARGGSSVHNYALAVDMALIIDGKSASWDVKADWDGDKQADWMEVVLIFKRHGWEWGGDWRTFRDMPHFQKTFGHSVQSLKNLRKDAEGYVII